MALSAKPGTHVMVSCARPPDWSLAFPKLTIGFLENRLSDRKIERRVMAQAERAAALKRVPIFAELSDKALERVAQSCAWSQHESGEQILSFQDPSTKILFLLSGKARVVIYSSEGQAVVFRDLTAGTMFGEIAAIDRMPRSASVESLEPCTVAALSAENFEDLILEEPSVALATLQHLAANVRALSERVFEFSTLLVQNRVQAELLRLAGETGGNDRVVLSPAPSLSDIAARISTHREAVSREFSRLGTIDLLHREGPNLIITSVSKLAKLVHDAKGD
jgi:CRP-like cAMP-binding protein